MKDIEKIIETLTNQFKEVLFDIDITVFGDGSKKWCIYVNDFDFYMNDKRFKKWLKILRAKYKKVKFYCAYQSSREIWK